MNEQYSRLQANYEQKLAAAHNAFEKINKKVTLLSYSRLMVFIAGLLAIYFSSQQSAALVIATATAFLAGFIFLVKTHSYAFKQKQIQEELIKIYSDEISALKGDFSHFQRGESFSDDNHPYSYDLDLFGLGSVYQYINRTCTALGSEHLAHLLKYPLKDKSLILNKQQAIAELSENMEMIEYFRVTGNLIEDHLSDRDEIIDWSQEEPLFYGKSFFSFANIFFPLLNISAITLSSLGVISANFVFFSIVITLGFLGKYFKKVNLIQARLGKRAEVLLMYSGLLKQFESVQFKSTYLLHLQQLILKNGDKAHIEILRLSKIASALDNRNNMIAGFMLNIFLLWDVFQVSRLEKWKHHHKALLPVWFDIIAEIDTLFTLTTFRLNHPDFCFPEIADNEFVLLAKETGHPLIHFEKRVSNDFEIHGWKQFQIITGANMAGKSTFLRTIGTNLVLAMTGAPVCAVSFKFLPVDLLTSLRTNDSLFKNESYFYAELKRLKNIIDHLNDNKKVFIILDEILKGTNSKDKQAGSIALLKQLISLNAVGIIATHDIALGDLESIYPQNIINQCFEVDFVDGHLNFTYKLRRGVSQNMNATFLMKQMGITVEGV